MKLNFTSTDLDAMFAGLSAKVTAGLPIAVAIAMTATAVDVQAAIVSEMQTVFDRPTPWTLNSTRIATATPSNLSASVWIKDEPSGGSHVSGEYLIPEINGGVRAQKRSEYILSAADILPPGMSALPGAGAELDAYGNMSTGLIQQVLSALRVSEAVSGHTSNRPVGLLNARQKRAIAKAGEFFVAAADSPHGRHLQPGIYQRLENGIKPIMIFVRQPEYHGILDFDGVANAVSAANFGDHLREQIAATIQRVG